MESLNLLLLHPLLLFLLLLLIVIVICNCCYFSSMFTYNSLISIGWSVHFIANQSDLYGLRPTGPSARYLQLPAMLISVLLRLYLHEVEDLKIKLLSSSLSLSLLLSSSFHFALLVLLSYLYVFIFQNACGKSPCQNGGKCQSGFTKKNYHCLCPSGFMGGHCQYGKDN